MENKKLEIACFNLESAIIAQENGADRIEFCTNRKEGGTTPDFKTIQEARLALSIDLNVMIRPRAGNFVYSEAEFQQMKTDIEHFKKLNIDGFVFGILKEDQSINKVRNTELVALAKPLSCTFHRAFDEVKNREESLEILIECGFKAILTSGQEKNAIEGIDVLSELVVKAKNRIIIMPGGGLRSVNIRLLNKKTKARYYHSSAIIDGGERVNEEEVKTLKKLILMPEY